MHSVLASLSERSAIDGTIYKFLLNGGTMKGLLQKILKHSSLSNPELELFCKGDGLTDSPVMLGKWVDEVWAHCDVRMEKASQIIYTKCDLPLDTLRNLEQFVEGMSNGVTLTATARDDLLIFRKELTEARYVSMICQRLRKTTLSVLKATWWFCMMRCNGAQFKTDLGDRVGDMEDWDDSVRCMIDICSEENVETAIREVDAYLSQIG